jgi:hypothetical protein
MRCVADLGERGNGKVDGRGFCGGSQPRRSYANLIDDGPINRRKGLAYAANAFHRFAVQIPTSLPPDFPLLLI